MSLTFEERRCQLTYGDPSRLLRNELSSKLFDFDSGREGFGVALRSEPAFVCLAAIRGPVTDSPEYAGGR